MPPSQRKKCPKPHHFRCVCPLTPLVLESRFGDKPVKFQVVCPQNGTAVLKGLRHVLEESGSEIHPRGCVISSPVWYGSTALFSINMYLVSDSTSKSCVPNYPLHGSAVLKGSTAHRDWPKQALLKTTVCTCCSYLQWCCSRCLREAFRIFVSGTRHLIFFIYYGGQ